MRAVRIALGILAVVMVVGQWAWAQTGQSVESDTPPETGRLSDEEKAQFARHVLMPSPAEVFVAMNRMGETDWTGVASFNPRYDYSSDVARALNLGVRAADGFLAIQAKDKARLGDMIVIILTLAEELMVERTILDKGRMFDELSREGKWEQLHGELNTLRDDMLYEIKRLGEEDIALLVSAGGWLEGMRAMSEILSEEYDSNASALLYQPRLVAHFSRRISELPPDIQAHPAVSVLAESLPQIQELIDVGFQMPVPRENVARLREISSQVISMIEED